MRREKTGPKNEHRRQQEVNPSRGDYAFFLQSVHSINLARGHRFRPERYVDDAHLFKPIWKRKTYDEYLGDAALKRKGPERWNRRLRRAIGIVEVLVNYDTLYLGGGNSRLIDFALPENVKRADNIGGITGGVKLWDPALDDLFPRPKAKK